uniref:C3H1-type domain-containing protein n=1 Tax=Caenorhabditis japonica TaxID=281687 RepID=A0A8R1HNB5_CAEJA
MIMYSPTAPIKGILRAPGKKRQTRRIFFADTRGFPLTAVKEIERIALIHHSNNTDFRTFEKNEACLAKNQYATEEVDWNVITVRGGRRDKRELSESARREELRLSELNLMRGPTFGTFKAEFNPELDQIAQIDAQQYKPTLIPNERVPSEKHTLTVLRDLPLPGRPRPQSQVQPHPAPQNTYEQVSANVNNTVYQATIATTPSEYYTSAASTSDAPKSAIELPTNLKEMLAKLKSSGLVTSEDAPAAPATSFPLAAAMQTAQQMIASQQTSLNQQTNDEVRPEIVNGNHNYVGEFQSVEMYAQEERHQDTRQAEGWTQSSWKIQEPCAYFINRREGCNRGDQCRFIHDEDLMRQKQAGYHRGGHDDRGFRGGRRGTFRGGFRHTERDFRDRQNGFHDRPGRSEFDAVPQNDPSVMTQPAAQMEEQPVVKKRRVSRFDQRREDTPSSSSSSSSREYEVRPTRRNRFDEGPPATRSFRSRFDERPTNQDDRNGGFAGQRMC